MTSGHSLGVAYFRILEGGHLTNKVGTVIEVPRRAKDMPASSPFSLNNL